jgi:hypothetical protein
LAAIFKVFENVVVVLLFLVGIVIRARIAFSLIDNDVDGRCGGIKIGDDN